MKIRYRIYTTMSRLVPVKYRQYLEQMLVYAGEKRTVDFWVGSASVLAAIVFLIIVLSQMVFFPIEFQLGDASITMAAVRDTTQVETSELTLGFALPFLYIILILISFLAVQFLVYISIYFKAQDRTKRVEESLPDALQLISANLRAGMTPFQALKLSARKEFGPLKEEIEHATTKALGTGSFSEALLSMTKRIKSAILDRSMKLFATSMKSGSHLAQLLEDLANDIAETKALKKELVSNTKMYSMLIMFMVIIGAPLLLSVSIYFVRIISDMHAAAGTTEAGFGMAFLAGGITLTPEFLTKLSIVILFITSLLASMLMGVIIEGEEKYGLKYAPMVITGSLIVFVISQYVISSFFGSL